MVVSDLERINVKQCPILLSSCVPRRAVIILMIIVIASLLVEKDVCIRNPDRIPEVDDDVDVMELREQHQQQQQHIELKKAVFCLGSFWRSEAVFGCLRGVVRTTAGYAGGSKANPEYRNLGDHAEAVQVEYDPSLISFKELLDAFWSSHDPRQVFGQGPDVGNQYRSIIFTNGTEESRIARVSKENEQARSRSSIVTTQIQELEEFYPAEPEHQYAEI